MSLEAIIGILLALFGGGGFLWARKKSREADASEARRKMAEANAQAAHDAKARAEEHHTVAELLAKKAAERELEIAKKYAAELAKAHEETVIVDAAEKKGSQALSDLANEKIKASRKKGGK